MEGNRDVQRKCEEAFRRHTMWNALTRNCPWPRDAPFPTHPSSPDFIPLIRHPLQSKLSTKCPWQRHTHTPDVIIPLVHRPLAFRRPLRQGRGRSRSRSNKATLQSPAVAWLPDSRPRWPGPVHPFLSLSDESTCSSANRDKATSDFPGSCHKHYFCYPATVVRYLFLYRQPSGVPVPTGGHRIFNVRNYCALSVCFCTASRQVFSYLQVDKGSLTCATTVRYLCVSVPPALRDSLTDR